MERHNAFITALERKRFRDRKAQRTIKEKREARIRHLEERVAFCERQHGGEWESFQERENLRRENEMLRTRQECLRRMFDSWGSDDAFGPRERKSLTASAPCHPMTSYDTTNMYRAHYPPRAAIPGPVPCASRYVSKDQELQLSVASPLPQALPSAVPPWCLVPMNYDTAGGSTCTWLSRADLIIASPPQPSPLALLYGTRRNWLADEIHRSFRKKAIRDSECLALGLLKYNYSKWRASPSPSTFARLTTFQRPTLAQLQHGHPVGIDLLPWPQLRSNLVHNWQKYNYVELIGYLSCCVKVRWPWGQEILERDEHDNLQIRQDYMGVFTRESGWGLTSEFINRYPELLEGMDVEALRFQMVLDAPDI